MYANVRYANAPFFILKRGRSHNNGGRLLMLCRPSLHKPVVLEASLRHRTLRLYQFAKARDARHFFDCATHGEWEASEDPEVLDMHSGKVRQGSRICSRTLRTLMT